MRGLGLFEKKNQFTSSKRSPYEKSQALNADKGNIEEIKIN